MRTKQEYREAIEYMTWFTSNVKIGIGISITEAHKSLSLFKELIDNYKENNDEN